LKFHPNSGDFTDNKKTGDEIQTGDGTGEEFTDNFNSFLFARPDLQQVITIQFSEKSSFHSEPANTGYSYNVKTASLGF